MTRVPILFVLSGPSGVGKDSLIGALRPRYADIHYAVTATTRARRPGETQGKSYYFVSRVEFENLLNLGELLAPAVVHGHCYGAPLQDLRSAIDAGQDILLKIDVQGASAVRRGLPQAVFIFLAPPSLHDLIERLRARHTESDYELNSRVRDAIAEMDQLPEYDYAVVNREGALEDAVHGVGCIITAERHRVHREPVTFDRR